MSRDLQRVRREELEVLERAVGRPVPVDSLEPWFRDVPREVVIRHVYEAPVREGRDWWAEPEPAGRWPHPMRLVAYVFGVAMLLLAVVLVVQSGLLGVQVEAPPWLR
jgi:hypothetical protein